MTDMVQVKTAELTGPALDWAVAHATKAWEFAHEWFPTMTLDPRFIGIRNIAVDGCVWLEPRNPFRQDPQPFIPSTDWAQGGPLTDRCCEICKTATGKWMAVVPHPQDGRLMICYGDHLLVAMCRAIVEAYLGVVVKVPAELVANDNDPQTAAVIGK